MKTNIYILVANLCFRPFVIHFYFMKTAKIPVYGNIGVYGNTAVSVYKMDHTLRCLEFIGSVSSP